MEKNSYLSGLKFDPSLLTTFRAKYLSNVRLVILFVILIIITGISSFLNLPRRLNPEVKIPIVSVNTVLPGASPKDMEELITNPLEDAIKGKKGISSINSFSNESFSTIIIEFDSSTSPEDAETEIKSAVDTVTNLPEDAKEPTVRKFDFEDQPIWEFAVKSNDPASLLRFSKILEEKLENDPAIDRVVVNGLETQEIQILASPEKVVNYGINPLQLSSLIRSQLQSYPAGSVATESLLFPVGINPTINSIDSLRNTIISVDNGNLLLSDIADVQEATTPNLQKSYIADKSSKAYSVATFSVYKNSTATIDKSSKSARQIVDDTLKPFKNSINIVSITNSLDRIEEEFGNLNDSFRDTLILVFITFLIFLGIRQALIAVLTIPLTFLVTFTVMNAAGLSLNFLTLFSLLLALGLLVDDTIVVVTSMTSYYRTRKFTPHQTGLLVWRDLIVPIWSTTITTSWAFLPLLLSTGIIGEFIKSIPIVVATTLYSSTAIAVLITIPLMIVILKLEIPKRVSVLLKLLAFLIITLLVFSLFKENPFVLFILALIILLILIGIRIRREVYVRVEDYFGINFLSNGKNMLHKFNERIIDIEGISFKYKKLLLRILSTSSGRKKVIFTVIIFAVFSYLLVPLGLVTNEFFPKSDNDYIYVNLELPNGTNEKIVNKEALDLLENLRSTNGVSYTTADIGKGIDPGAQDFRSATNLVLFTLTLPPKDERKIDSLEISDQLREDIKKLKTSGTVSVVELSGGPPAGADVQVKLLGDDLNQLDNYANELMEFLKTKQGIINVTKSINPGTSKLNFAPDLMSLSNQGVSQDSLGLWLRTFTTGFTIKNVQFENQDSKDIVFRMNNSFQSPEDLGRLSVPSRNGSYIPILTLGKFELETNPTTITHLDTKRTISVSAGVTKGYSVTNANKDLLEYVQKLNLPEGYEFRTGGVNEENQKSVNSILQSMLLAGVLILSTMVIQFRSYRKALIVMLIIPVAIAGVLMVFALTGTPLSFPALIGILSLFGIVVTHAMFLVDKFNRNLAAKMNFNDAIADGAASRLEPVFLGSLTTIVGLIPISLSNPLWRGLGGAIIAGLSFSGIIMLFLIPVVFYYVYRNDYDKRLR